MSKYNLKLEHVIEQFNNKIVNDKQTQMLLIHESDFLRSIRTTNMINKEQASIIEFIFGSSMCILDELESLKLKYKDSSESILNKITFKSGKYKDAYIEMIRIYNKFDPKLLDTPQVELFNNIIARNKGWNFIKNQRYCIDNLIEIVSYIHLNICSFNTLVSNDVTNLIIKEIRSLD